MDASAELVFAKEALSRLPLAEAVLRCWRFVFSGVALTEIFERYRGRSYESVLTFETIVNLTGSALLEHRGSGNQAFTRAAERKELNASTRAVYDKLGRIPISLSDGFLRAGTLRLAELWPALSSRSAASSPVPRSLRKMNVLFVDGKKIKQVPRLLKAARGVTKSVLGGKTITALSWNTGLVQAIHAHPDGEVSDAPLVPGLLEQLNEQVAGQRERLFVLDRQFCDLVQPAQLTARARDHFLIRYNHKVKFFCDETAPVRQGVDEHENSFAEEWGWIGKPNDARRRRVRRITLTRSPLPHDPNPEPVILITDLLDADKYPAVDLLQTYRGRWNIETVFQKITEVFHLKSLIATSPEGTVFQFAFCLLLYNMVQLLTRYLSQAENIPASTISQEKLFVDVHRQLIAWHELVSPAVTLSLVKPSPHAEQLRGRLTRLLSHIWTDRWLKAPPKKTPPPHHDPPHIPGTHTSLYRLMHPTPNPTPTKKPRK